MNDFYKNKFCFVFIFILHSPLIVATINELKTFTDVIIFCPSIVRGGPESFCQLCSELNNLGLNSYIVWTSNPLAIIDFKNNVIFAKNKNIAKAPDCYKQRYNIKSLKNDFVMNAHSLIVLPEVFVDVGMFLKPNIPKMIYWVSYNYFFTAFGSKHFSTKSRRLFLNYDFLHFHNCCWTQKQLFKNLGIKATSLVAPIATDFFEIPQTREKKNTIVYSYKESNLLANNFITKYNNHEFICLKKLNREKFINCLDSAKVFIDFGDFPGRERLPREAMLRNCIIFIHNVNAATDSDTFCIDDFFRFNQEDIASGLLERKITYALANYEDVLKQQDIARSLEIENFEIFTNDVKKYFIGGQ